MLSAVGELDAGFGEGGDGVVFDVDDVDVGTVELLVVVELEAGALDAEGMGWLDGGEEVASLRVADAGADVLGPEVVCWDMCQ